MEGLGRVFNIVPTADAVEVNMRDCSAVTFIGVGANAETFTVEECTDAAGTGAQSLTVITHHYRNTSAAGAAAWTRSPTSGEAAAAALVTTLTATPVVAVCINSTSLSAGFDYLRCSSSSTGLVYAIVHDLVDKRTPQNLPALAV